MSPLKLFFSCGKSESDPFISETVISLPEVLVWKNMWNSC